MTGALYTVDDVAARLHKSRRWLREFVREKQIGFMAGRTRLLDESDVQQLRLAVLHESMDRMGERAALRPGYIYFMASGDFIKIGYSKSPDARFIKMSTDSPMDLELLHIEPGTVRQEKVFHRHFAAIRTRGEWFHKTPDLLNFIEDRKRIASGTA